MSPGKDDTITRAQQESGWKNQTGRSKVKGETINKHKKKDQRIQSMLHHTNTPVVGAWQKPTRFVALDGRIPPTPPPPAIACLVIL